MANAHGKECNQAVTNAIAEAFERQKNPAVWNACTWSFPSYCHCCLLPRVASASHITNNGGRHLVCESLLLLITQESEGNARDPQ